MSTELDDEILQRYYDGDLSPVEERAVQNRVAEDPMARRKLAAFAELSELMQLAASEAASNLDSEAMFAQIEAQIAGEEKLGLGQRLRVIASDWADNKRHVVLPFIGAAAAAAVVSLMFLTQDADENTARTSPTREKVRVAKIEGQRVHGSRVEQVDFGQSTGTVFEIESSGIATAVVWIADEEEEGP